MQTGERLDDADALYGADLARHRAAYRFADAHIARRLGIDGMGGVVVDLGCGSGYGAAALADAGHRVFAFDRWLPANASAGSSGGATGGCVRFVRGALERLPFRTSSVDCVVSFQVIEHFADPSVYLDEIGRVLHPHGVALLSTPNRLQSDGENPYHLREYSAPELTVQLAARFQRVELVGVHAVGPAALYHADRLRQIRRIVRLDPLGLRRRIPRSLVEQAFARLSVLVRRMLRRRGSLDQVRDGHYVIGPADADCLDLVAVAHKGARGGRSDPEIVSELC